MTNIHTEAKHEMIRIERGSDRMSSERYENKGADRKNAKDWRFKCHSCLTQRSRMWGGRKRASGGDNACLRGHTGGPEVYFCLSLGLLGITQGYKEEKCWIFHKLVMLCLRLPQKHSPSSLDALGLPDCNRDGDGGGWAGEGRSLLVQRMTIRHTGTLTHSMTQHHFCSPWQP